MKKILFLFGFISLFFVSCGGNDDQSAEEALRIYEEASNSLKKDSTVNLLTIPSEPTVSLSKGEICVSAPKVQNGPPVRYFTIKLTFDGDSISRFSCEASSGAPQLKSVGEYGNIISGDTKNKIALRLGIGLNRITNKEPLQVGQKITVK